MNPGFVVWFTGLPASGKTTIARAVQARLHTAGLPTILLDSDELRRQLTPHARYTPGERDWFYATLAFLSALLARQGVNVLVAATAPRRLHRDAARDQVARFAEVFVDCPLAVCRARDSKGLYAGAAAGVITTLPGVGVAYEAPPAPDVHLATAELDAATAVQEVLAGLCRLGWLEGVDGC